MKYFYCLLVLAVCLCACRSGQTDTTYKAISYEEAENTGPEEILFTLLDSTATGITFFNPVIENEQINILTYEYLYNGGGVAAGDINNDGLVDLYFTGNMVPNKLYLNQGNFKFKDITASSGTDGGQGYKTGVTMADVNNDGYLDLFVCKSMLADPQYRKKLLYINNGDLTFTERAAQYGLDDASFSTQAYFFDMDTDGDLDLYLLNHPSDFKETNNIKTFYNAAGKLEIAQARDLTYISDKFYENQDGYFTDISTKAGIRNDAFGLSVAIGDFNNDLKPDLYVCNDYIKPDFLYINNGNNTFTDKFSDYFQHSSFSSMGSDYADINNDGCLDLMTLDMLPREHYRQNMMATAQNYDKFGRMLEVGLQAQYSMNTLQLSDCNGRFSDIAFLSNTAYTDWSWAVLMADYDNDGWKDMFVTNGYKRDVTNNDYAHYTMDSLQRLLEQNRITLKDWVNTIPTTRTSSFFFRNRKNLAFSEVSGEWSTNKPSFSNGAAYADLDNDGYLDLVVNNIDDAAFIYKNEGKKSRKNNFIRFIPVEKNGKTALGTKVKIYDPGGNFQVEQLNPSRGFISSIEPVLHFGIGQSTSVTKAEVIWPDGKTQIIEAPEINKTHRVEKDATGSADRQKDSKEIFFTAVSSKLPGEMRHVENSFNDFDHERLLHQKYSEEGPATAAGDINNDGLDDVYIGGSLGNSGKLFVQKKNGKFELLSNPVFEQDKTYEDVAALFIDLNGDNYKDLIVISGGNERKANAPEYKDRIYLNDGKGNFRRSDMLPDLRLSGATVAASDIDKDGDLDLFIGSRVSPGEYPVIPQSVLLLNEKGRFINVTQEKSEGLEYIGMVTDSKFADLDKDGIDELIITGEWMPVSVFKNQNGKFKNITPSLGLSDLQGWWYSLEIADVNNDGFPEIIAGNLGLNSHIQASREKPVTLHYKDFDKNGTIDPIICCYSHNDKNSKSYPLHFRDRLAEQIPSLKSKFIRYNKYASAGIDDIFTKEQLKDSKTLYANTFSHTLFINSGGKKFIAQALPRYTQISSVRSIKAIDVNNDNNMDLVIGGNIYATDAQFGRYDASVGALLLGKGNGEFEVIGPGYSGLSIPGNVRRLLTIQSNAGLNLLVVRNNDYASCFHIK